MCLGHETLERCRNTPFWDISLTHFSHMTVIRFPHMRFYGTYPVLNPSLRVINNCCCVLYFRYIERNRPYSRTQEYLHGMMKLADQSTELYRHKILSCGRILFAYKAAKKSKQSLPSRSWASGLSGCLARFIRATSISHLKSKHNSGFES